MAKDRGIEAWLATRVEAVGRGVKISDIAVLMGLDLADVKIACQALAEQNRIMITRYPGSRSKYAVLLGGRMETPSRTHMASREASHG